MPTLVLAFTVYGDAVPQGSMSNYGYGRVTHSKREAILNWRHTINVAVQQSGRTFHDALITKPVAIRALFYAARPKSTPKKALYKHTAPDLDKLQRALGDALEGTVLTNDALVACWHTWKLYTDGASRLDVEIWELETKDVARVVSGVAPKFQLFIPEQVSPI